MEPLVVIDTAATVAGVSTSNKEAWVKIRQDWETTSTTSAGNPQQSNSFDEMAVTTSLTHLSFQEWTNIFKKLPCIPYLKMILKG